MNQRRGKIPTVAGGGWGHKGDGAGAEPAESSFPQARPTSRGPIGPGRGTSDVCVCGDGGGGASLGASMGGQLGWKPSKANLQGGIFFFFFG